MPIKNDRADTDKRTEAAEKQHHQPDDCLRGLHDRLAIIALSQNNSFTPNFAVLSFFRIFVGKTNMMDRIFHKRVTPVSILYTVILAGLALYFFWQGKGFPALIGFLVTCLTVVQIEQTLHTTYTFTADRQLKVYRGRFFRSLSIPVNDIVRAQKQRGAFGFIRYLLLEYGAGRLLVVVPDSTKGFLDELAKRQYHEE